MRAVRLHAAEKANQSSDDTHASATPAVSAAFDAACDWAMCQDFDPDHAERVRREAWGRDERDAREDDLRAHPEAEQGMFDALSMDQEQANRDTL